MSRHLSYDNTENLDYKYSYPGMVYVNNNNNKDVTHLTRDNQSIHYGNPGSETVCSH